MYSVSVLVLRGEKRDVSVTLSASFSLIRIFQKILRVVSFRVDHESYETSGRSLTKKFIRENGASEIAHLVLFGMIANPDTYTI